MPLYEYRCQSCQHQFEVIQKFSDPPIGTCPSCGQGPVVKLLSSPAIQFKGSGWYVTDYARAKTESGKGAKSERDDAKAERDKEEKSDKSDKPEKSEKSGEPAKSAKSEKPSGKTDRKKS